MTITIETDDGRSIEVDTGTGNLTIGSDASCDINFPGDERLLPVHARLSKVLFQWRLDVESPNESSVSISEKYGESGFLQASDRISLSADGPVIIFRPRDEPEEDTAEPNGDADAEPLTDENVEAENVEAEESGSVEDQLPAAHPISESPPMAAPIADSVGRGEPAPPVAAPVASPLPITGDGQEPIPALAVSQSPVAQEIDNPTVPADLVGNPGDENSGLGFAAADSDTRPARRNDGSPVGVIISAALGGLTVFGIYKLLLAMGVI